MSDAEATSEQPEPVAAPMPEQAAPEEALPAAVQEQIESLCRGFVEKLRGDYEQIVNSTLEQTADAAAESRTAALESIAEATRRIRAEESVTDIATALVDTAVLFCSRAVLLINKGDKMLGFRAAGAGTMPDSDNFQRLTMDTVAAASVAQAIGSLDTVVTTGAEGNVSKELAQAFAYSENDVVHVYPLRLRDKVLAVVLIDGGAARIESAAVETLIATAEAWIEAVGTRRKAAAN